MVVDPVTTYPRLEIGQRVRFVGERPNYKVRAVSPDGRYVILTRPFNLRRTVFYTIIDFKLGVRGTDNRIFDMGYETPEQVESAMTELAEGRAEVSYRNWVWLRYDDDQMDLSAEQLQALRNSVDAVDHSRQNDHEPYVVADETRGPRGLVTK